ncbi:MAG: spermidine/putrescine ABC transporter substrate-binding protein [Clostridium sp.]|nr:spermidine/putrescine ABC transporter substrate-binding protein [Clostridium sp.]
MKKIKKLIALSSVFLLTASFFTGCSDSKSSSDKVINVFNCADYIDEDLITKFEEETGYTVNYSTYDTNENMYSKLTSGSTSYDLVFPSDYMVEKLISENLVEEINYDNVPNFKYVGDDFKNLSYDPNNKYSVPYMWGTIGIIYNPDFTKKELNSWNDLWDDAYKGEVVLFNSVRDTMGIALKRLGYSMNSSDPNELAEATDSLIELKEKGITKAWVVDEVKDMMISGEASIATVWSGDANYILDENPDLVYVVPDEGSNKWFDSMCIPTTAQNKEGAEAFINFLCEPENALKNVEYIGYYTPITEAYNELDDEIKERYPSPEVLAKCEVFRNLSKKTLELYNDEWIRIGSY